MIEEIIPIVEKLGFPIVAFILMYKMASDTIKENSQAINRLNESITRLCEKVG